ncbi:MAG: xanthine dehydrogenase molybdopterin binding subunit [Pseudomonadota bacterium]
MHNRHLSNTSPLNHIGAEKTHDSAELHVSGKARYVDDIPQPSDTLFAYVGQSECASGEITSMNLDAVRAAEGVIDIITSEDIPGHLDIGPVFPGDPLLVDSKVSHFGQAIFAVLATSQRAARQAARLAKVEYKPQIPVLTITDAMNRSHFVRPRHRMQRGDAEKVITSAPILIEREFSIGGQEHFYLEGQVALAQPQDDDGVQVYTSTQHPTEVQKLVAEVLGISFNKVVIVTRRMGGGFGGKETQAAPWACIAALFAVRNNCAVKLRLARREDMSMTGKRHPFLARYRVACKENGELLGVEHSLAGNCGHSPDLSDAIVDRAMFHSDNAYFMPHAQVTGYRCKTHQVSHTAFRGFGGPKGIIAMESAMDDIARAVRCDPLDVRKTNLYGNDDRNLTHYDQQVRHFTVPEIIDRLEQTSNYRERRASCKAFNDSNPILKKGLALTPVKFGISFTVTHLNQAGALLLIYTDGSIHLNHGGTEMGQGLYTKVAQIVADVFGVSTDTIRISAAQTDKVPNTSPTAASSGTDLNGMAAFNAAQELKSRLKTFVSEHFSVGRKSIEFANNHVSVGDKIMTFAEVSQLAYMNRIQLSAAGYYKTPDIHYDRETASGRPFFYYANGAACTEMLVDTLTGETRCLRADILHDVGRSINPAIDKGQIEGGFIQGLGWLTSEELRWDDNGRLLSDSPATYKIPAISDTPPVFNVDLLENSPNAEATVFHSKAVGEPPLMLGISGWCAIRDAVAAIADYKISPDLDAPATPENIMRAIHALDSAA